MINLGIPVPELNKKTRIDFKKPGLDPDVVDMRFKHYQQRTIRTVNMILNERKKIESYAH